MLTTATVAINEYVLCIYGVKHAKISIMCAYKISRKSKYIYFCLIISYVVTVPVGDKSYTLGNLFVSP